MLVKNKLSVADDVGQVYEDHDKFYRGISSKYIDSTLEIIKSGLLEELINNKLFPETVVSDKKILGYDLVLEHKKIEPITYPFEWSPEMLRQAGLAMLEVNDICGKYGYELKDAQPYNIVYEYNKCLFVDFGSIEKIPHSGSLTHFKATSEFLMSYYYPLYLYSTGAKGYYNNAFLKVEQIISHTDFYLYRSFFIRMLPMKLLNKLELYYTYYIHIYNITDEKIDEKCSGFVAKIIFFMKSNSLFPFSGRTSKYLKNKITGLDLSLKTQWGEYHKDSGMISDAGEPIPTKRLGLVLEWVKKYKPYSVLELAGNQGALSKEIEKIADVKYIICSDYDHQAIDSLYSTIKNRNDCKILPVLMNFIFPVSNSFTNPPEVRLKSELVIALAVTHHLILTQNIRLDFIIETLFRFTEKYLIIEFMPLGLHNGVSAPPLPDWYTKDWFIEGLEKKFSIISEIKIEENRVVFMAKAIS